MKKTRARLTAADIKGCYAIIPTPAKPGSERWDAVDTVDVDETARITEEMIKAGADGLLTLGTLGEAATLTEAEKKTFTSTVVDTARGRIPIFAGTSTLNTRDTIALTRWADDVGCDGAMVGPPFWCAPSVPHAVSFFKDLGEACPNMAIAIYANHEAFKFDFSIPFWAQVSQIPQVVTAKLPPIPQLATLADITGRRIKFLPIDNEYYQSARMMPDFIDAFWSSSASCGPEAAIELRNRVTKAKKDNDWEPVRKLSLMLAGAVAPIFPKGGFKEFSTYNIRLEKERMIESGWVKAGPTRAPYMPTPEDMLEGARLSGRNWAKVCKDLKEGKI